MANAYCSSLAQLGARGACPFDVDGTMWQAEIGGFCVIQHPCTMRLNLPELGDLVIPYFLGVKVSLDLGLGCGPPLADS